ADAAAQDDSAVRHARPRRGDRSRRPRARVQRPAGPRAGNPRDRDGAPARHLQDPLHGSLRPPERGTVGRTEGRSHQRDGGLKMASAQATSSAREVVAPDRFRRMVASPVGLFVARLLIFGAFLLLWEFASDRLVSRFWISSPSRIFAMLWLWITNG